jgi:hypothetical protein
VTDRVAYCVVEQVGAESTVVKFHALEVKDGELDASDQHHLVNAVCTLQLPRLDVKQDRSWQELCKMSEQGDLGGRPPLCERCKAWAGAHRAFGATASNDPTYHLVTLSAIPQDIWTGRCGTSVTRHSETHVWDGGCGECDPRSARAGAEGVKAATVTSS